MASLTPGVLSKLLQNVGNSNIRVAGEHRSVLLQVIGILPSFSGENDDIWKSKGFYLRVSDSVHSAYVSVNDTDVELILDDTIQLGQFLYVTRFDCGSPVPVINGLKVLKKRRACVGEPKDLISSEVLLIRDRVDLLKNGKKDEGRLKQKLKLSLNVKIERFDPSRKAWDCSPTPADAKNNTPVQGVKSKQSLPSTPGGPHMKSFSQKDLISEQPNSNIAPLQNKNVIVSEKLISKPVRKDLKPSFESSIPSQFKNVPVRYKTWSDRNILCDSALPPKIKNLGKEVIYHRNVGFFSAVRALEETSASEGILKCMSAFAGMCESARQNCTAPLVEQFLNLYQSIQKSSDTINSLLNTISEDNSKTFKNKIATLWVQAAIDTNLSMFSLFRNEDQKNFRNGDKTYFLVLENSSRKVQENCHLLENTRNSRNPVALVSNSRTKTLLLPPRHRVATHKKQAVEREKWPRGKGLKDAANLADKLLTLSRTWFLNYLEDSLREEFGLKKGEEDSEITGVLGQLKRVNGWLNELVGNGSEMDEKIECLRKNLYQFLLDRVDSSIVQTGN